MNSDVGIPGKEQVYLLLHMLSWVTSVPLLPYACQDGLGAKCCLNRWWELTVKRAASPYIKAPEQS